MQKTETLTNEAYGLMAFINAMQRGETPLDAPLPDLGDMKSIARVLAEAYNDGLRANGPETAQSMLAQAIKYALSDDKGFAFIYQHARGSTECDAAPWHADGFITLGKKATLSQERIDAAQKALKYVYDFADWSESESPRGHRLYHEALAVIVLSIITARRVVLPIKEGKHTPLSALLIGNTSKFAKSTTMEVTLSLLRYMGMEHLLLEGNITPEAFYRVNADKVEDAYGEWSEAQQRAYQEAHRWKGKRSIIYDEWGSMLAKLGQEGSVMAGMKQIMLTMDDGKPMSYTTNSRGKEDIREPYMAFCGGLPLQNMQDLPRSVNFWKDGLFARLILLSPPPNEWNNKRTMREIRYPQALCDLLQKYHETLGIPGLPTITEREKNGKTTGHYDIEYETYPRNVCAFGNHVIEASTAYDDDLTAKINTPDLIPDNLHGNYSRHSEKALRVAAMLAWVDNGGRIELYHWDAAQILAETWRVSLHTFYNQLMGTPSEDNTVEKRIIRYLEQAVEQGKGGLKVGEISGRLGWSSERTLKMLDSMYKAGELTTYRKAHPRKKSVTVPMYTTLDAGVPDDAIENQGKNAEVPSAASFLV